MFRSVTLSLRNILDVVASVLTLGSEVAESFVARASRTLKEGEELAVAAVLSVQIAVVRMIEDCRDNLEVAEKAHRKELRREVELRERRDLEQGAVYQVVLDVRGTFDGTFGKKTSEKLLGLDPGLGAVDVQVLRRHAWEAVEELTAPGFTLPGSALSRTPEQYADAIRVPLLRLETTLQELAAQKRRTQKALKVKTRALEACRKTYTYGSRWLGAHYVLAGEDFYSERLRPTSSSKTAESVPEPFPLPDPTDPVVGQEPVEAPPQVGA